MVENVNEFYITLLSNSLHPSHENTPNHFCNLLRQRLDFNTKWEVALVEFTYQNEIYNFSKKRCKLYVMFGEKGIIKKVNLEGYFKNVEHVLDILNKQLKDEFEFILFDGKIKCTRINKNNYLRLSPTLAKQLGFFNHEDLKSDVNYADQEPNLDLGIPTFAHIYCNLIPHQIHGNRYDQILRSVVLDHSFYRFGGRRYLNFHWLMYLPVVPKEFEDIKIDIKDDDHNQFPLHQGPSSVVLHFRKTSDGAL